MQDENTRKRPHRVSNHFLPSHSVLLVISLTEVAALLIEIITSRIQASDVEKLPFTFYTYSNSVLMPTLLAQYYHQNS